MTAAALVNAHEFATNPALQSGEIFQLNPIGKSPWGCGRQGGCNAITPGSDQFGPFVQYTVGDGDQKLPNNKEPGGCFPVHRAGVGVAACLIAPFTLAAGQLSVVRLKLLIPSAQPGLKTGMFPTDMTGKWFSPFEAYGPPYAGAGVTGLAVANDPATGVLSWVFGPGGKPQSFWWPIELDQPADIIISVIPSTDPKLGGASVTCNGSAVMSRAGNAWEFYATATGADDNAGHTFRGLVPDAMLYRSNNFGGSTSTKLYEFRIGDTIAAVTDPPPPVFPAATTTPAESAALWRYITTNGIPTNSDGPLIQSIDAKVAPS